MMTSDNRFASPPPTSSSPATIQNPNFNFIPFNSFSSIIPVCKVSTFISNLLSYFCCFCLKAIYLIMSLSEGGAWDDEYDDDDGR